MKWISIKDRLPDYGHTYYIIWDVNDDWHMCRYGTDQKGIAKWFNNYGNSDDDEYYTTVTHWLEDLKGPGNE